MAATLKVRAGSSLKAHIKYHTPEGALVDTTGFTARFQLRATQTNSRVILDATQGSDVITLVEPGHWRIFLGKSITNSLPPTSRWELELTSDSNSEDVTTLGFGVLNVEPEVVSND